MATDRFTGVISSSSAIRSGATTSCSTSTSMADKPEGLGRPAVRHRAPAAHVWRPARRVIRPSNGACCRRGGALCAPETRLAPGNNIGCDPALPVGRPGERDEAPLTGNEVLHFDGVTDGEDIRIARVHLFVYADPTVFADLQSGHSRQRGIRAHAEGEDHNVSRIGRSGSG